MPMKISTRILVLMMVCTLFTGVSWATEKTKTSYSELDQALQYRISSDMGRENPAYHFAKEGNSYTSRTFSAGVKTEVNQGGVTFTSGAHSWSLSLKPFGASEVILPMSTLLESSKIDANRLEFTNGPEMTSWYVNGPGGFQQGWTINSRHSANAGNLLLSMNYSGDLNPTVMEGRRGLSLRDENGLTVFNYQGLIAYDAANKQLPVWFETHGQTITINVDDSNAQYPVVVDPWVQSAKLTASDKVASDNSGFSISISSDGSTVATGAYFADYAGVPLVSNAGAVYVYVKPANGWFDAVQTAKLSSSDKVSNDWFGATNVSVSSDGSVIAVSNYGSDPGAVLQAGAVYVFVRPVGGWIDATQTARLTASDKAADDQLGWSCAISSDGSTVAAGAYLSDVGGILSTGALYVFEKPANGWADCVQKAKLTASDYVTLDKLGYAICISPDGSTIAGSAINAAVGGITTAGAVYVYEKPVNGWVDATQTAKLSASDKVAADVLGTSVSTNSDGSVIVAGVHKSDPGGIADAGAAYIFVKPVGSWVDATQTAKLTASDKVTGDWLGYSTSLSYDGSTIAVGAYKAAVGGLAGAGAVYLYSKPQTGWIDATETSKITASDGLASDFFGKAVSLNIDGSVLAVGANGADPGAISGAGASYVFASVPTGISEARKSDYVVYPVPANDYLMVKGQEDRDMNITIYSIAGNVVAERKISGGQISLTGLNPGMYFLKIEGRTYKIIKK